MKTVRDFTLSKIQNDLKSLVLYEMEWKLQGQQWNLSELMSILGFNVMILKDCITPKGGQVSRNAFYQYKLGQVLVTG